MTDTRSPRLFRSRRLRRYARRTAIYSWLRTYHDLIENLFARGQGDWTLLAADMARDGITGRDGAPPRSNAALRIWQRVCRDVEEQRRQPRRQTAPSRLPQGWRSPTATPQAQRPLVAKPPQAPAGQAAKRSATGEPPRPLTPEEQRNVDRANAQMDALFAKHDEKLRF